MSQATVSRSAVRLTPRAAGLVAILLLLVVASAGVVREYWSQRTEIDKLEQQVDALEADRVRLEQRIEDLKDPAKLERLARVCLGMVRPGEIAFVVPGKPPPEC
ncbi:MAG TPA: septum formation initiator family protein [Actinomycetota bacterium]|nr:septum formation initiator family protein [Actinomycetota bacterium]